METLDGIAGHMSLQAYQFALSDRQLDHCVILAAMLSYGRYYSLQTHFCLRLLRLHHCDTLRK